LRRLECPDSGTEAHKEDSGSKQEPSEQGNQARYHDKARAADQRPEWRNSGVEGSNALSGDQGYSGTAYCGER
jgi:hypothetical protein